MRRQRAEYPCETGLLRGPASQCGAQIAHKARHDPLVDPVRALRSSHHEPSRRRYHPFGARPSSCSTLCLRWNHRARKRNPCGISLLACARVLCSYSRPPAAVGTAIRHRSSTPRLQASRRPLWRKRPDMVRGRHRRRHWSALRFRRPIRSLYRARRTPTASPTAATSLPSGVLGHAKRTTTACPAMHASLPPACPSCSKLA